VQLLVTKLPWGIYMWMWARLNDRQEQCLISLFWGRNSTSNPFADISA